MSAAAIAKAACFLNRRHQAIHVARVGKIAPGEVAGRVEGAVGTACEESDGEFRVAQCKAGKMRRVAEQSRKGRAARRFGRKGAGRALARLVGDVVARLVPALESAGGSLRIGCKRPCRGRKSRVH
jgi:hypothetical protein